ncbi:hypothetical protein [Paenibacillus alkalitolerans]|nr:hypothetical protein [Paenibacillus alkalitolerans]
MKDDERYERGGARESDLSVWRGILFGIAIGAVLWVGILWLAWELLF